MSAQQIGYNLPRGGQVQVTHPQGMRVQSYVQNQQVVHTQGPTFPHYGDPGVGQGGQGVSPTAPPMPQTPLAPPLPPGPPYYTLPAYPTILRMSARRDVANLPMTFSVDFNAIPAGTEVMVNLQFSFPTRLTMRMGSGMSYTTDVTGIVPVDFANGTDIRDWTKLQFVYNGTQFIDVVSTLAQNIVGTAQRPGMFGAFGWTMLGNTVLQIRYTPLLDNLYFTTTVQGVQIVPGMDAWSGAGREMDLMSDVNVLQQALAAMTQQNTMRMG